MYGEGDDTGKIKKLDLQTGAVSTYLDSFSNRPNPDIFVNFNYKLEHEAENREITVEGISFTKGTTQDWILDSPQEIKKGRYIIVRIISRQFKGKILVDSITKKYMIVPTDLEFIYSLTSEKAGSHISDYGDIYSGE